MRYNLCRVSNPQNESMRINSKGMCLDRANLGVQKAMKSLAAAPLSFSTDSIFQIQVRDQKREACR